MVGVQGNDPSGTDGPRAHAFLSNLCFCGTKATCPKNFPLLILKMMPGKEGSVGAHDAFPLGLSSLTSAPGRGWEPCTLQGELRSIDCVTAVRAHTVSILVFTLETGCTI